MDFDDNDNQNDIEEIQDPDDDIFGGVEDPAVQDIGSRKDAVLFVLDCRPCIFQAYGGSKETQISKVLNAFSCFLKSKIISSVDDRVGLIFFNCEFYQKREQNPLNFKGIDLVYPLESPSAERIKNSVEIGIIQQIINYKEANFYKEFGFSTNDAALYEVLWLCNHEFKTLDHNKFSMRIFLFTAEDSPNFKDRNSRDQTIKHARQLKDMNVDIELFPLYRNEEGNFQINKFYQEIIIVDPEEVNNAVLDTTQKIMDLQQRIRQKEFKKRALNRILMDVGDDVQVGLKVFCLINKAKKPIGKPVERKTNSILKKKAQFLCNDTGKPLFPSQIGTYFPLGNEKVLLSKEQMNSIKGFEKPGMRLIGFKPLSSLKEYHNYRTSYFIYPDDEHVTGSSQFFDALISQMISKQKLAIVRLVPRQGSTIRFCALLPQAEKYDEDHFQSPPGMHMIFLPYSDDIRGLNEVKQEGRNVSKELVNCTKIMVNALTINDFDCQNFEDPTIQRFFAYLQGHALGEQQIDEPEDVLQPDYEGMSKYRDIINLFQEAVDVECSDAPSQRRGGGGGGRGQVKRQQNKMEDEQIKRQIIAGNGTRGRGRGGGGKKDEYELDDYEKEFLKPKKRGRGRG